MEETMKRMILPLLWMIFVTPPVFAVHYAPDIQRIRNKGTLVVAVYHKDIDLMFFRDSTGTYQGVDFKMAHDIAKKLGVKVVFDRRYQTYNAIVDAIADHKADIAITNLSNTLTRAQKVLFSKPYLRVHMGLLINRKKLALLKKEKIGNLIKILDEGHIKVAVIGQSAYVDMAKKLLPNDKIVEYTDWETTLTALKKGEVTAAFDNEINIKEFILREPEQLIYIETAIIYDLYDNLAMAIPWNSYQLRYWLNQYLEQKKALKLDDLLRQQKTKHETQSHNQEAANEQTHHIFI